MRVPTRRVSCLLDDSPKMHKILAKVARNKLTESELLLVSLRFAEELESIKTDFGPELDMQLKELVTKFANVTQESQGLPPHRGIFDHKIRLTAYLKRQRRNRLSALEYAELKRQCTDLFKQGLVRVSKSSYVATNDMHQKSDGYIRVCVDYRALNECTMKDSFPIPRIDDLLDKLRSAKCLTHLDLRSAYNRVRMSNDGPQDDSIATTAFQGLTPNGASLFVGNAGYGVWPLQCCFHIFPTYESCVETLY